MAKTTYRFNVGDKVFIHIRCDGVETSEQSEVERVSGRWCWTVGSEHDWTAFDRTTGTRKEDPIPGFSSRISHNDETATEGRAQ